MRRFRRPIIAVATASVLVLIQALLDPTGLLALVGWPGGTLQWQLGWPLAPYLVFLPVLLGVVWWAAGPADESEESGGIEDRLDEDENGCRGHGDDRTAEPAHEHSIVSAEGEGPPASGSRGEQHPLIRPYG